MLEINFDRPHIIITYNVIALLITLKMLSFNMIHSCPRHFVVYLNQIQFYTYLIGILLLFLLFFPFFFFTFSFNQIIRGISCSCYNKFSLFFCILSFLFLDTLLHSHCLFALFIFKNITTNKFNFVTKVELPMQLCYSIFFYFHLSIAYKI